MKVVAIRVTRS